MIKTLLLVDGNALVHRAYHALPSFKTHEGTLTNAVYGFASMLLKTVDDFNPSHICVAFDTPAKTFRKELSVDYQAHRPKMEDELSAQFPYVKEFLESAQITHLEKPGFEADDVIGTVSKIAREKDFKVFILTGDKDLIQLVDDKVFVITPIKGLSEVKLYNEGSALEKFGIPANKIPDLKGLMGDQSDNYKGVPGIGPKTAVILLTQFGSVENMYAHLSEVISPKTKELLKKNKESALLSKKLATIIRDLSLNIDIEKCIRKTYNQNLKDFFTKLEFNSLSKRYFAKQQSVGEGFKPSLSEKEKKPEKKEETTDQLNLF